MLMPRLNYHKYGDKLGIAGVGGGGGELYSNPTRHVQSCPSVRVWGLGCWGFGTWKATVVDNCFEALTRLVPRVEISMKSLGTCWGPPNENAAMKRARLGSNVLRLSR